MCIPFCSFREKNFFLTKDLYLRKKHVSRYQRINGCVSVSVYNYNQQYYKQEEDYQEIIYTLSTCAFTFCFQSGIFFCHRLSKKNEREIERKKGIEDISPGCRTQKDKKVFSKPETGLLVLFGSLFLVAKKSARKNNGPQFLVKKVLFAHFTPTFLLFSIKKECLEELRFSFKEKGVNEKRNQK